MKAPLVKTLSAMVFATAAAASAESVVCRAPFAGKITSATYIPNAALNGANTNTRRLDVVNKGQSGAGVKKPATLQFNAGVNLAAYDEKALTLSATATDLEVVAGDVIALASVAVGTGAADGGGLIVLQIARTV